MSTAPWQRTHGIATYQRNQSEADATTLAEAIHGAQRIVNQAHRRWRQAGRSEHDGAYHALRSAEMFRDLLLHEAREKGLEFAPAVEEPARFTHPGRTLGIGVGIGAALIVAWIYGSGGLHGAMVLLAVFAALGWVVLK